MRSTRFTAIAMLAVAVLAAGLAGCSSSKKPKVAPGPLSQPVAATTPATVPATPTAAPTPTDSPKGAPNTIDPCKLVTQQEASALTGASFGPGKEEADSGVNGSRRCVYGANTKNVFTVIVVVAASVAEAQTQKDAILAQAQQELPVQAKLTAVSGVGDAAEFLHADLSQIEADASGIYVLKGTVGFALVDLRQGGSAPSQAKMTSQANTVIGRLP